MKIRTIGIDLAKGVFQTHSVDAHGKALLRKQSHRSEMAKFFANRRTLPDWHGSLRQFAHWARKLCEFGHTVKLMLPIRKILCEDQQA